MSQDSKVYWESSLRVEHWYSKKNRQGAYLVVIQQWQSEDLSTSCALFGFLQTGI